MKKGTKTNAVRKLEQLKIGHDVLTYEVDENDLSALNVSTKTGIPIDQMFKTIVCRGDKNGVLLACIPGDLEVDMKKLAKESHNKKVESVHLKEVLPLTGYIRGGVSPIGTKKPYPLFISHFAKNHSKISISAGVRGQQIVLAPEDLITLTKACVGDITKEG